MANANSTGPGRVCPWCSAPVPPDATRCPACGDALAQRESIDGLAIPGVTIVDPALEADAERPLHIPMTTPAIVDPFGGGINLGGMAQVAALAAPHRGAHGSEHGWAADRGGPPGSRAAGPPGRQR